MSDNNETITEEKEIETWKCPVCGSLDIDCFDDSCESSTIIEHFSCGECDSTWDIFYTADCIVNIKKGNDND